MKKNRFHFNPALAAAVLSAIIWFALWLMAFQPAPAPAVVVATHPALIFWPKGAETIRRLHSPTLFALPSKQGFSGTFPEDRVNLKIELNHRPEKPDLYLHENPIPRIRPEQPQLDDKIVLPYPPLPIPAIGQRLEIPHPNRVALFLSPELQNRTGESQQLDVSGDLPAAIRAYLVVEPDGTVSQVLFDKPVKNQTLAGAIRRLQFAPALDTTSGWLEIRITPSEKP